MKTRHASAETASPEELERQIRIVENNPVVRKILDAVPEAVLILNSQRQIVHINQTARGLFSNKRLHTVLGQRPGNLLNCENSGETPGGCGTTESCVFCGAVNAILSSQKDGAAIEEARISLKNGNSMDLKIKASPFFDGDDIFTVFALSDISSEKRKEVLERTFFHDILNTASGLSGYSELLLDASQEEVDEYKTTIYQLSRNIIEEINAQKLLVEAENELLETSPVETSSLTLLMRITDFYLLSAAAYGKNIKIDDGSEDVVLAIDETLLLRVLGNMLKNALEASADGETIRLSCRRENDKVVFSVNNPAVMPEEVRMQVFKRSFSTKGKGRGIGTYSMKLLTEKYLQGRISFSSVEGEGTTFEVRFPVKPKLTD